MQMTNNIVIFSGGRGTKHIQSALIGSNVNLTFIVNGYDSGLSTGLARKNYEGLLGPSDFRKSVSGILELGGESDRKIAQILESRDILCMGPRALSFIDNQLRDVDFERADFIHKSVEIFVNTQPVISGSLDLKDFALGNAVFVGHFIKQGSNFNLAQETFSGLLLKNFPNVKILNVSNGEDLWLVALSKNYATVDEGTIVQSFPLEPIEQLALINRSMFLSLEQEYGYWKKFDSNLHGLIADNKVTPKANISALQAIEASDLIIYGSGTMHSSILPSFLTHDVVNSITNNERAIKSLFVNGERDTDFALSEDVENLIRKFLKFVPASKGKPLTDIVFLRESWDKADFEIPMNGLLNDVNVIRVKSSDNRLYTSSSSFRVIANILVSRFGVQLLPTKEIVSVISPILDERSRIQDFLSVIESNTVVRGKLVENILVDGGSVDGTYEYLESHFSNEIFTYPESKKLGRFAAINCGLDKARGDVVLIYPADLEYEFDVMRDIMKMLEVYPDALITTTRASGVLASLNLAKVYSGRKRLYWLSRLGGQVISFFLSIKVGQAITDPFTSVFGGKQELLRKIVPDRGDVSGFVNMILNCKKMGVEIIQVNVNYSPRGVSDGKKTNLKQGLLGLVATLGYLFKKH